MLFIVTDPFYPLFWQVIPKRLAELMASSDPAVAERTMQAILTMTKLDMGALEAAARADPGHGPG